MAETMEQAEARYMAACHAMQSGVAGWMAIDEGETEPKHLRVGINSAMVSNAALVKVLVAKGIITYEEMMVALADEMDDEVRRYEERLQEQYGVSVVLR